jgi:hypothetical protein
VKTNTHSNPVLWSKEGLGSAYWELQWLNYNPNKLRLIVTDNNGSAMSIVTSAQSRLMTTTGTKSISPMTAWVLPPF